jgi:hypothetical protein
MGRDSAGELRRMVRETDRLAADLIDIHRLP